MKGEEIIQALLTIAEFLADSNNQDSFVTGDQWRDLEALIENLKFKKKLESLQDD